MTDHRELFRVSKATLAQWHQFEDEVLAVSAELDDCFLHVALDCWADRNSRSLDELKSLREFVRCLDGYGRDAMIVIE